MFSIVPFQTGRVYIANLQYSFQVQTNIIPRLQDYYHHLGKVNIVYTFLWLSSGRTLALIVNTQYPDRFGQKMGRLPVSFIFFRSAVALPETAVKYRWEAKTLRNLLQQVKQQKSARHTST